jgi:sugar phosphate isomerase/epimerase
MHERTRRSFLKGAVGALGCGVLTAGQRGWGIEAFERVGEARLRLGLAAYSFRQYFRTGSGGGGKGAGGRTLDLFEFMDFCAEQGCEGAELTSYYFPKEVDRDYLLRIRRHGFLRGLAISGTAVGNVFTWPRGEKLDREVAAVKGWIDRAVIMGAPHVRIFAGNLQEGMTKEEARGLCVEAIEACCEYAGERGVFLGLENHGGIVSEPDDLWAIVRRVRSPWFGVNLDTGNFHTADPYGDLERFVPYAVNVQVKVEIQRRGGQKEAADLERLVGMLKAGRYQGYVVLEYEGAEDPWEAVPRELRRLKGLMG